MYVVSCVDAKNFVMAEPLKSSLYIYITCITRVYNTKADFLKDEPNYGLIFKTNIKALISVVERLRYEDSPIMIPYTTVLAEMELDWDWIVERQPECLIRRVLACHERYVGYFKQLAAREDEVLQVQQTFANIRKTMQRFSLT